jgi:hypothetical protein
MEDECVPVKILLSLMRMPRTAPYRERTMRFQRRGCRKSTAAPGAEPNDDRLHTRSSRSIPCAWWRCTSHRDNTLDRYDALNKFKASPDLAEHCAAQNVGAWIAVQGCSGTTAGIHPG